MVMPGNGSNACLFFSAADDGSEENTAQAGSLANVDGLEINEAGVLIRYSGDATVVVISDSILSL